VSGLSPYAIKDAKRPWLKVTMDNKIIAAAIKVVAHLIY
jgi:hypothetical protein